MTKLDMKKLILKWTASKLELLTHKQLRDLIVKNECTTQN
jgi:hypothetical protein